MILVKSHTIVGEAYIERGGNKVKTIILALITGFIVGFVFALFKLPIPAPPALAGVMGIVGIYAGFKVYTMVSPMLESMFK